MVDITQMPVVSDITDKKDGHGGRAEAQPAVGIPVYAAAASGSTAAPSGTQTPPTTEAQVPYTPQPAGPRQNDVPMLASPKREAPDDAGEVDGIQNHWQLAHLFTSLSINWRPRASKAGISGHGSKIPIDRDVIMSSES